jgi:lysophospholipase L1-like esterase
MELTGAELERALLVFHAALTLTARNFAPIPILLVYLPSPLAVYRLAAERVPIETTNGPHRVHASAAVERRSDRIGAAVAAIAAAVGVDFLDARPVLRAIARDRPVHGPGDWGHLNRTGYEALGRAIAGALQEERGDGRCRPRAPVATAGR